MTRPYDLELTGQGDLAIGANGDFAGVDLGGAVQQEIMLTVGQRGGDLPWAPAWSGPLAYRFNSKATRPAVTATLRHIEAIVRSHPAVHSQSVEISLVVDPAVRALRPRVAFRVKGQNVPRETVL